MHYSTIKINASKLWQNYLYYLNKTHKKIIPVIKSNAYGHGMYQVAFLLQQINVETLAVATYEEAQFLRHHNIGTNILILNPVETNKLYYCYLYNFIVTIPSINYLKEIKTITFPLYLHLKINTGLNRFGIDEEETQNAIQIIDSNDNLILCGIYSHLVGGKEESSKINEQIETFNRCISHFKKDQLEIHLTSTNSIDFDPEFTTSIRVGLGLYGLDKNAQEKTAKIIELNTKIINITKIKKGGKIGYNSTYEVPRDGYVYTIPLGYADFPSKNIRFSLFINSQKHRPIVRFMNSTQFFSTNLYNLYDEVTIIDDKQSLNDIAKRNKKSPYELAISLPKDINREIIY